MKNKPVKPEEYKKGKFNFYGEEFFINPNSYITPPESEIFINVASDYIRQNDIRTIVDVGTGSGTVALTLKRLFPYLTVIGTDICPETLKVAKKNSKLHGLEVELIQGSYFENFSKEIDKDRTLITSILPYGNKDFLLKSNVERYNTGQFQFYPQTSLFPKNDPERKEPLKMYGELALEMIKNRIFCPLIIETGVVTDDLIHEEFKKFQHQVQRYDEDYSVTLINLSMNKNGAF